LKGADMSKEQVKREAWKYKAENADSCPFCGNDSVSVAHKEVRYLGVNCFGVKKHMMQAYCTCNKCHAKGMPIKYVGYSNYGYFYDNEHLPVYSCGDKAIEAWNRRT
jgi:hypothetical protein